MKRTFILILIACILFLNLPLPLYGYTQVSSFLCDLGIKLYNQGDFQGALHEFNKALIAQPDNPLALEYINKIKNRDFPKKKSQISPPAAVISKKSEEKTGALPVLAEPMKPLPAKPGYPQEAAVTYKALRIDEESFSLIRQPIQIEQAKSVLIEGSNISRFLVTSPNVMSAERKGSGKVLLTAKEIGHTYLHVWDSTGLKTLEFLSVPIRPEGPAADEALLRLQEQAGTFKARYSMDWNSYEEGRRIDSLERRSYAYTHAVRMDGQTPYGNFESNFSVRSLMHTTDLTSLSLGLREGTLGRLSGFTLRAFDYVPNIANLSFPSTGLRGAMIESPAFNKKINYTAFWGREGGGRFGNLSPGLSANKRSYLTGLNLSYIPFPKQYYNFTFSRGWGYDRPDDLNRYNYDLFTVWNLNKVGLRYEIAHDSENLAHLFTTNFSLPKSKASLEIRDTSKKFRTATGWGWRIGEIGGVLNVSTKLTDRLSISNRLDAFRDRLYFNPEHEDRWNQDLITDINYAIDPLTYLRIDYGLQNYLGKMGPYRYYTQGVGVTRTIESFRKIYTFLNYRHQENRNYTSPSLDYRNDKINTGLRFALLGELYYYLNYEFNWLFEKGECSNFNPHAMETGLDWSRQIFRSPFYGNMRFIYRDEENTVSNLSLLSGQDYIEGYGELSYRPNQDIEIYSAARMRNIWADNPRVSKRLEMDFRSGMRYLWDTGIRWESVGVIDGYVFKDFNGDGLRDRDDPPLEGVKVWLGKDRWQLTDVFGYFKFTKVKAKKTYVTIGTEAIPAGFMLTVPLTQEASIVHGQATRINFGISSRTEISGTVFEDKDGDGRLSRDDLGLGKVILLLEDGTKVVTDNSGRYFLRNLNAGKHSINLDLNSLPAEYLPTVPLFKVIELYEGASYVYDIPVRKTK